MSFGQEKPEGMKPTPVKVSPVEEVGYDTSLVKATEMGFDELQAVQPVIACGQYQYGGVGQIVAPAASMYPAAGEVTL